MEILNSIFTALTTSNLELSNYIVIPFAILETLLTMLLFVELLDFKANKKQMIIYVSLISTWSIFTNLFIPKPYSLYLNMIALPTSIICIFRVSFLKSIVATILPFFIVAIFESIIGKIFYIIFSLNYESTVAIPILRITIVLLIYLGLYLLYKLLKKYNLHLTLKNVNIIKNSSNKLFIINFLLGILAIATQSYLMTFYANLLPFPIIILSTISLITYFAISIYSLIKTSQLETTSQRLEETKLYNKTLELLYDNIRAFRHDFNNIIQAFGGYVDSNDMDGLRKYFKELNRECIDTNNLNALNPKTINNPAIYSILASKYYKADKYDIKINLEIFLDLNTLNMNTYQFTRILGILLDNAIEASMECEQKIINVAIRNDFKVKRQILVVENTYNLENEIDIENIFKKGVTSKSGNTGLGLWEIRQILHKNKNLNLFTSNDKEFFTQQLEIYAQ